MFVAFGDGGGDGGEDVLPGLDGEDVGGRADRRRIDAEEAEHGRRGDIESDRAVDAVAAGGLVRRGVQADNRLLAAGLRLAGRVDGHVEGDHGGAAQRSGDPVHRGSQCAQLGRRPDGHQLVIARLADPDLHLVVRQVARICRVGGRGQADHDRYGDPQGQADRGKRRGRAGLVPGQVTQRQPHRNRSPAASRGQDPDAQRADERDAQGHGQRAEDDQRTAGLVGQGEAGQGQHDQQHGHDGGAVRWPGLKRAGPTGH